MNCVLILILHSSVNNIHRFRLDRLECIFINIIQEIRHPVFGGKMVLDHPSRLIFHSGDERLVEPERKLMFRPYGSDITVVVTQTFLNNGPRPVPVFEQVVFGLQKRFHEPFHQLGVFPGPESAG